MDTAEGILYRLFVSRFLLILLCFFCIGDVAWCQGSGPRPYWSEPGYKVSAPQCFWPQSNRAIRGSKSRAMPKAPPFQIQDSENVTISEEYGAGSIVIINRERKLYFVEEKGKAIRYPVAIGSPADEWQGVQTITTAKRENPIDIQIESDVPRVVSPGPGNPLGVRALYLGDTLYRIHGTNRPASISAAVSHGCLRMFNQHIVELHNKVQIGANVYVVP